MSPLFFILLLDDLGDFMKKRGHTGFTVPSLSSLSTSAILNLILILFADDTTLVDRSTQQMQKQLESLSLYSNTNNLSINNQKTFWIGYSIEDGEDLYIGNNKLERVKSFCYLGVVLSADGSMELHATSRLEATRRAFGIWSAWLSREPDVPSKIASPFSTLRSCRSPRMAQNFSRT